MSFVVSCNDYNSVCINRIIITEEEIKKLNDYVKANITDVDDSYKGDTTTIEGKKYPTDEVEKARKKVLPEVAKKMEECNLNDFWVVPKKVDS